jgi:hypothetical protein
MPCCIQLFIQVALIFSLGCAHRVTKKREEDRKNIHAQLAEEMSLKSDRDDMQTARKDIPLEKQKTNDELALYLSLMKQGTEKPQVVREKFSMLMERKRVSFREKVHKLREVYRRDETKRRDDFLNKQRRTRDNHKLTRRTPEQSRDFYGAQEKERLAFTADERDRRTSFEAELNAQSKDFDSYMREKNNEFNEQLRLYSKKFADRAKDKSVETGAGEEPGGDYQSIDEVPTKPLGTEP